LNKLKKKTPLLEIQAIRWPGTGTINKKYYTMYYSGSGARTGHANTGFMVMGKTQNNVIEFSPMNERACKLRGRNKYNTITPMENKENEV
jgi:hypothetical protein